jgi:hypothetical protein
LLPLALARCFWELTGIVDEVQVIAAEAGATPAQIALVWLLAQGVDADSRHQAGFRVEENTAQMRIGILGSGLMGGKLGTIFAKAGHEVVFSYSRSERKLKRLAREARG